jgi:hypothetical protein
MTTKPLPTFKHTSIGAQTHKARTATAHVSYIMRSDAMTKFQAQNMPDGGRGTRVFFDKLWEKAGMPENARIADKLMIALPLELTQEQRYEAVQSFMQALGKGRIAWCAAHHDSGKDAHNPHAHIVFKDADIDTGRKVVGTTTSSRDVREATEHGWKVPPRTTTADLRKMWCNHLNACMERAGLELRYDPRTLKAQGIDREAQIHIGPKAQALHKKGYDFESHDRIRGERSLPYTLYDHDSRARHNSEIIAGNKQREQERSSAHPQAPRSPFALREQEEKRALRETQDRIRRAMYIEQQRDRAALRQAHSVQNHEHRAWAKKLYAGARQTAYQTVKEQYAGQWKEVRGIADLKDREEKAETLKLAQKQAYAKEAERQVQLRRPEKDAAWQPMHSAHEQERLNLHNLHRQETTALARKQTAERFGLHEKWRAFWLDHQANRISANLTKKQSMPIQQKTAGDMYAFHARVDMASDSKPGRAEGDPHEAMQRYFETVQSEQAKQQAIRAKLLDSRAQNLERAGIAPDKRQAIQPHKQSEAELAVAYATGRQSPHQALAPGLRAAKRAAREEHIHASPESKSKYGRDQSALDWAISATAAAAQKGNDRSHGGGRSGGGRDR